MADLVDTDTLLFAQVRALHLAPPRQVADDLLAAADDPGRLEGVTPTLTRIRAADVLSAAGGSRDTADAIAVMRATVELAIPSEAGLAVLALGKTLAEAGDRDGMAELASTLLGDPSTAPDAAVLLGFLPAVALFGYASLALRWADEAIAAARGAAGRRADQAAIQMLTHARERVLDLRSRIEAEGTDPDDPAAMRARMRRRPADAGALAASPPWPALTAGGLAWWPEPAYERLLRQLPDIGTVLGFPWRSHTARVEAALRAGPAGRARQALIPADIQRFAQFLERSAADPRPASTMTAFTRVRQDRRPAAWPPRARQPCWCGSGRRYAACCALAGAAS